MRIAQVVFPSASEYERKCQRADRDALAERHEVTVLPVEEVSSSGAGIAHVYATGALPAAPFVGFPVPYVSSAEVRKSRWMWRKPVEPGYVVGPFDVPEVVEDVYFGRQRAAGGGQQRVIGSFARDACRFLVEQAVVRIQRTRDDVTWRVFDRVPTPEDLAGVDLWVDPATSENDYDGFVAEALVVGVPVVATRTEINASRLEKGRIGFLVPPSDPNEMTHAILAALFKPEVASNKVSAARQTASKFRAKHRLRVLAHLYETLIA